MTQVVLRGPRPQDNDAGRRHEVALAVFLQVVADLRAGRDQVGLVDDGIADPAVPADLHPIHDHRVFDMAVAMDAHITSDNAVADVAAADDGAFGDDRIDRHALAVAPVEDEFCRRIGVTHGA